MKSFVLGSYAQRFLNRCHAVSVTAPSATLVWFSMKDPASNSTAQSETSTTPLTNFLGIIRTYKLTSPAHRSDIKQVRALTLPAGPSSGLLHCLQAAHSSSKHMDSTRGLDETSSFLMQVQRCKRCLKPPGGHGGVLPRPGGKRQRRDGKATFLLGGRVVGLRH